MEKSTQKKFDLSLIRKNISYILILLLLICLATTGYFYFKYSELKDLNNELSNENTALENDLNKLLSSKDEKIETEQDDEDEITETIAVDEPAPNNNATDQVPKSEEPVSPQTTYALNEYISSDKLKIKVTGVEEFTQLAKKNAEVVLPAAGNKFVVANVEVTATSYSTSFYPGANFGLDYVYLVDSTSGAKVNYSDSLSNNYEYTNGITGVDLPINTPITGFFAYEVPQNFSASKILLEKFFFNLSGGNGFSDGYLVEILL